MYDEDSRLVGVHHRLRYSTSRPEPAESGSLIDAFAAERGQVVHDTNALIPDPTLVSNTSDHSHKSRCEPKDRWCEAGGSRDLSTPTMTWKTV